MEENQIVSLPEARARKAMVAPPVTIEEKVCHKCKFPLADSSHGWVREDRPHTHSEQCQKRYGYCLIPCPLCSGGIEAKRQAQLINDLFGDAHIPFYAREWNFGDYLNKTANPEALETVKKFVRSSLADEPGKRGL